MPLKRKPVQEISFSESFIKQIKILTGLVQKIYLQNENQTSQEIIINSVFKESQEPEAERTTIQEAGVSDEAKPISEDQVSKEFGEATPDKRFRSTPKLLMKKIQRRRIGQEIKYTAFFTKWQEWRE